MLAKSLDELKLQYYPGHEGNLMQDMHWECAKKNPDALLPIVSVLDVEVELKAMSKDSKESLLQFICKF